MMNLPLAKRMVRVDLSQGIQHPVLVHIPRLDETADDTCALVREYRKYLGRDFGEEKSELLEIRVLGAGCAVCAVERFKMLLTVVK